MTPFTRLQNKLSAGLRPLKKDIELLVAYHAQAVELVKYHGLSDQYYIGRYRLEQLNTQLHGMVYDYSTLMINPAEEVVRLEKLQKKYRETLKKRGYKLTFWYWRKTKHRVPEDFKEMVQFMAWYEHKLQWRKQHV